MKMEKASIPANTRNKLNPRLRNYETDIDAYNRKLLSLSSERSALFGNRYKDDPTTDDQLEQRQQLLSGTDRLTRSSGRLTEAQRIAIDTENIGAATLSDLARQRQTIENTRETLLESEGYTDRSIKTLRGMARRYCALPFLGLGIDIMLTSSRMATNRIITIAIITVLVLLILAVLYSKFK